jgi:hypothetical protein
MIAGYVPAIGETDLTKISRSIRNIYENADQWQDDALTAALADYTLTSDLPAVFPRKVGSFTRDLTLASSSQAITGTGFQPRLLVLSTGIASTGAAFYSISGTDGTTTAGIQMFSGSSFPMSFIALAGTGGSDFQSATLTSLDSNGFTLAWTKNGTPTGTATISYWAIL